MIKVGEAPFLECSSKGEKRLSAFYARIKGRRNFSIEELYQAAKIFEDGTTGLSIKEAKGKKATNQAEVASFYSRLWDEYFKENPDLVNSILDYNGFTDIFGQKDHCCQAIEIYRIQQEYKQIFSEHYKKRFELWLKAAYHYYHLNESLMHDIAWDSIGKELVRHWDIWEHPYKHLVRKEDMFTAFYIPKDQYPDFAKEASSSIL